MPDTSRPLAIVTGASSGIGLELAKLAVDQGYAVIIAADEPDIHDAARALEVEGAEVPAVETDLATTEGVDRLYDAARELGRPVEILIANAGRGLGHALLDQGFDEARRVVDTNIVGTIYCAKGRT
jgi:NAD(P)-dependent dehydrogenase (short-subunit alcohol dehydrogenase family)